MNYVPFFHFFPFLCFYEKKLVSETPLNKSKVFNFNRVFHCFSNDGNPITSSLAIHHQIMDWVKLETRPVINLLSFGGSYSGKTYTLFGTQRNPGILPLILEEIFNFINSEYIRQEKDNVPSVETIRYNVKLTAVELYDNSIIDLSKEEDNLVVDNENDSIRLNSDLQVFYVEGARSITCQTLDFANQFLKECNHRRHTAKFTNASNIGNFSNGGSSSIQSETKSSKGHVIFDILLEKVIPVKIEDDRISELLGLSRGYDHRIQKTLIRVADTAASNEVKHATHPQKSSREDIAIQKGITSILKCISALGKTNVIPYRDSHLTYLLREVFIGKSPLYVLATARPEIDYYTETSHNLKYIHRLMTHRDNFPSRPASPSVTRSRSNSTTSSLSLSQRNRPIRSSSISRVQSGLSSPATPIAPLSPSSPGTPNDSPRLVSTNAEFLQLKNENKKLRDQVAQLEEQIRLMKEEKLKFVRDVVMLAKNFKDHE